MAMAKIKHIKPRQQGKQREIYKRKLEALNSRKWNEARGNNPKRGDPINYEKQKPTKELAKDLSDLIGNVNQFLEIHRPEYKNKGVIEHLYRFIAQFNNKCDILKLLSENGEENVRTYPELHQVRNVVNENRFKNKRLFQNKMKNKRPFHLNLSK